MTRMVRSMTFEKHQGDGFGRTGTAAIGTCDFYPVIRYSNRAKHTRVIFVKKKPICQLLFNTSLTASKKKFPPLVCKNTFNQQSTDTDMTRYRYVDMAKP